MTKSLYRLDEFKDNCGFGLIAHLKGEQSHQLLEKAIESLTCMTHRGGIAADGKTGDGCGLLLQKPDAFLRAEADKLNIKLSERYGVGAIMLSQDEAKADAAKQAVAEELASAGLSAAGWRVVPTVNDCLGPIALESVPVFTHLFIGTDAVDSATLAAKLLIARRKIEQRLAEDKDFYLSLIHI